MSAIIIGQPDYERLQRLTVRGKEHAESEHYKEMKRQATRPSHVHVSRQEPGLFGCLESTANAFGKVLLVLPRERQQLVLLDDGDTAFVSGVCAGR